ncbi:MAG: hypothetical protein K2X08_07690, partial [Chlamydiales bacterium]|nr:hypothetical protein [Chlamydiales bacterium]MBY0529645.1 hypothetical protein [Rhabdochlamydiaceae bacterium]
DPLVGENACQIRAVKIALILRNNPNLYQERLDSIQFVKNKVKGLLATSSNFRDCDLTLKDVLNKCELNVRLTDDDKYLINSYILTTTKVVQPFFKPDMPLVENAYTDYKKIKEIIEVGSSFSCELIKKLRKDLAEHSSNYVTDVANNSSCQKQSHLLSEEYLFVHNGLKCLPYYWATRALMLHAKKNQLPIVMLAQQLAKDQDYKVVKNTQLFFISTPSGYQKTCRSKINPNDPVIVLVGSTCRELSELPDLETWENELLEQCPLDLVLSYAAAHRQYPNESHMLSSIHLSDADYEYHKAKAKEWGCSMINPSRFFLTHTFCDKIKNIKATSI